MFMLKKIKSQGFTIVEVLIATTIFSFAFGIITVGFIEIAQLYQQGVSIRTTQQSSKFILEEIVRTSRVASSIVTTPDSLLLRYPKPSSGDSDRLTAVTETLYCFDSNNNNLILRYNNPTADCSSLSVSDGENMLEGEVVLLDYSLGSLGLRSAKIEIVLGTGPDDLIEATNECKDEAGRQYCAVSTVYASVTARGGG